MLLIEGSVLVDVRDLENVIAQGGQLVSAEGMPLPVRMTVDNPKPVVAGPMATLILDAASAAEAERKLWASLTSTADGLVDRFFNRPSDGRFRNCSSTHRSRLTRSRSFRS